MKSHFIFFFCMLFMMGYSQKKQSHTRNNIVSSQKSALSSYAFSQYVIEANTVVLYDRSIHDPFASRKFFRCDDVFSLQVYAKLYRPDGFVRDYRVMSIIYDEKKVLDIDLRAPNEDPIPLESYLLGYTIEDQIGGGYLGVIKTSDFTKIEIYVKDMKTSISALTNMANDSRNVMADQIVHKKDNVGIVPYRRMNVLSDNLYLKIFKNNSKMKVIDLYRPAEIDYFFSDSRPILNVRWFVTAVPVDENGDRANGNLYYIQNPRIIEK